jgi:HlyD family secretion protein
MNRTPLVAAAVVIAGLGTYALWSRSTPPALSAGIAQANGRIEVERVDIATKSAGRVAEIRVREGDFVERGAIVARMDVAEQLAQLASARAAVRSAEQSIGKARADFGSRQAELRLHAVVLQRGLSQAEIDKRTAERDVAKAAVVGASASIADAEAAKGSAEAQVNQIQVNIDDMTLTAPVAGRVEYRLVQPGEIVAAGGRVLTLLGVSDVFMTIILPTS